MLTLSQFKSLLQISDSTYDDNFVIYEPVVADDVEDITHIHFDLSYSATTVEDSNNISTEEEFYNNDLFTGAVITGTGIPDDTYIWDWSANNASFSKRATASGAVTIAVNPLPSRMSLIVAKMILYTIDNSTVATSNRDGISSKSLAIESVTYRGDKALDKDYDYPKNLVRACRKFGRVDIGKGWERPAHMNITNNRVV